VLWALGGAMTGRPGYGAELHPELWRTAMDSLLCACCKASAARDERGTLWVLPLLYDVVDTRKLSAIPPMWESCCTVASLLCPRLRDGHVRLRVREAELIGVPGTLYPRPGSQDAPTPMRSFSTTPPTCRSSSPARPCANCAAPLWSPSRRPSPDSCPAARRQRSRADRTGQAPGAGTTAPTRVPPRIRSRHAPGHTEVTDEGDAP
jgi:hypothetical protein